MSLGDHLDKQHPARYKQNTTNHFALFLMKHHDGDNLPTAVKVAEHDQILDLPGEWEGPGVNSSSTW